MTNPEDKPSTTSLLPTVGQFQDLFTTPPRCYETQGLYLNPIEVYFLGTAASTTECPALLGRTLAYSYILARGSNNPVAAEAILSSAILTDSATKDIFNKVLATTQYNVRAF